MARKYNKCVDTASIVMHYRCADVV